METIADVEFIFPKLNHCNHEMMWIIESDTKTTTFQNLTIGLDGTYLMTRQWVNSLVYGIDNPRNLWKEIILKFSWRDNPVSCAKDRNRSIQMVKGQLTNIGCHRVQKGSALAGIRYQ